jgi:hypothetical protein
MYVLCATVIESFHPFVPDVAFWYVLIQQDNIADGPYLEIIVGHRRRMRISIALCRGSCGPPGFQRLSKAPKAFFVLWN